MRLELVAFAAAALTAGGPVALATPPADPRIRTVDYVAGGVITVPVSTNVVTRIVLERDEKIIAAAAGVPSKCEDQQNQWCIEAPPDANEVWIKLQPGAKHNNLELKTDRRNYSFDLVVGNQTTYRVELRYPMANGIGAPSEAAVVAARLANASPVPKNANYTLESNQRGADITPKAVFDDGTFTYFKLPGNGELPTIFVIGADGKEARTSYSMQGDLMVVQQLGRQFVLRLGKSVVSVWNEHFDTQGGAGSASTTVAGVARETVGISHGR